MSPHTPKDELMRPFRRERGAFVPFIPYIWRAAARLGDVDVEEMGKSATLSSKCLVDLQRLLGLQAVFAGIDLDSILEACGSETGSQAGATATQVSASSTHSGNPPCEPGDITAQGSIPLAMEIARRLISLLGHDVIVAVVVSGPLTLGNRLRGRGGAHEEQALTNVAKLVAEIVKGFCELRVDLVVITEPDMGEFNAETCASTISSLKSAVKICHYYDARCTISLPCVEPGISAEILRKTGFDGISLPIQAAIEETGLMSELQAAGLAAGLSIPGTCFTGDEEATKLCVAQAGAVLNKYIDLPVYCTTVEDLPYDVSINSVKEFAMALMDISAKAG
ncbi:MAG: hypothetical protein C4536_12105 [Actinobacteria bacterium]|jgi:hypothetical protein|nr:MAG: hypothetical protein C4536_12105 [Actinomycetota bacterium]